MSSSLFDDFRAVLTASAGTAHLATPQSIAADVRSIVTGDEIWITSLVPESIQISLRDAGFVLNQDGEPASVRDQPWGLTMAEAAIAETGSVILREDRLEHRTASLLTNSLIVICMLDQLYASLDDAGRILRQIAQDGTSYATILSGPSRTADIERQLTIGVQGPGAVAVIFLAEG